MFDTVIKYLGFLKHVPGLPLVFNAWLKVWMVVSTPYVLDWTDLIEKEVLKWEHTKATIHKYGGLQLNYKGTELGHIHGNGLTDMLLNRKLKEQLMKEYDQVQNHHLFNRSGWISIYLKKPDDVRLAIRLFRMAYALHADRE
jgi:hypothetical protein